MRHVVVATVALALGACAFMPNTPAQGVRSLGNGLYSISEIAFFGGDVAGRAATFCSSFGQTMSIEGNTTQKGIASGDDYAVLVFRCADVEPERYQF